MAKASRQEGCDAPVRPENNLGVDISELSARIRFDPSEGQIWLEGERMMLVHASAFTCLRRELIDTLGMKGAKGMLTRMGHASGTADAQLARRARTSDDPAQVFMAGPRLHAIEGMVRADPLLLEVETESGFHVGEWIWHNSIEVEAHLSAFGLSTEPVCWHLTGYASAYTSAFMGRPILYREIECRAMGAPRCRIIGKPVEEWDKEDRDDLQMGFDLDGCCEPDHWCENGAAGTTSPDRLIGMSSGFVSMMHQIDVVAATDAPVLLVGEPGSGKKSAARLIHQRSARVRKPFHMLNCAALQGEQLDIELFGIERSAAGTARQGRFERAHGGTLFLEDVHCLDLRAQTKLLRAIQERAIERVGGTQPRPVNVRLLASSNARLVEAVRDGTFREDLYYRIATMPILIPPLRERRADLPLLIQHFVRKYAKIYGRSIAGLSAAAVGFLSTHDYRGNIAELESMLERAVIMTPNGEPLAMGHLISPIEDRDNRFLGLSRQGLLIPRPGEDGPHHDSGTLDQLLESAFDLETFETELITRAVDRAGGNLSRAAKALGLTRPQLSYRYKKMLEEPGAD